MIRFSKFSLFIFSWFYVWKFRVNVSFNIVSRRIYSDTLRVETSRCCISLPGKHTNIAKLWDLFPKCASSTHLKSKSTAYIHVKLKYKYPLPYIPSDSMWKARGLTSLLCHFALFHSTAYPRWWDAFQNGQTNSLPNIRCSRNGSLDNDDTEESLLLLSLHKRNQQIRHRSRTPIFLLSLSAVDRKSVPIYCAQRRLFSVS